MPNLHRHLFPATDLTAEFARFLPDNGIIDADLHLSPQLPPIVDPSIGVGDEDPAERLGGRRPLGTDRDPKASYLGNTSVITSREFCDFCWIISGGSDGTRTRGLRRDRPAL
jgi:hypothetical protein